MKHARVMWVATGMSVLFLLLTVTACRKNNPPVSQAINPTAAVTSVDERKQQRYQWNLDTLVQPYEHAGYANPEWDASAKLALTEFARVRANLANQDEPWLQIISTNVAAAVRSGCKDPMINYLFIKFAMDETNSKEAFSDAFVTMQRSMNTSVYPPVRKFYATVRTLDQLFATYGTNSLSIPAVLEMEARLSQNFLPTILDKKMPPDEAYEVCKEVLKEFNGDQKNYTQAYALMENITFQNWPNDYTTWLLKGEAYIQLAWIARGGGYAYTVTEAGAKTFDADLAIADQALTHAWELNPKDERIPFQMMTVELGQGQGRDRMELWFKRAMEIDPNDYDACYKKMLYLEPKWYGSGDDMLEFGRFCVQNTNWGGRVPTVLVDAHLDIQQQFIDVSEQTNYWKNPEVWSDIQSAYNRCFQIDPDATDLYYYYARFAYRAEDWSKLNELIPKLGSKNNYDFFGGKDEFDKMVQLAKNHAGKPQ